MKKFISYGFIVIILILNSCFEKSDIVMPELKNYSIVREDSLEITISYKQSIKINDELIISFEDVVADSRCPTYAICVWAGDGEVKLKITKNGVDAYSSLHTFLDPKSTTFENYSIKLKTLSPYPTIDEEIKKENYTIELVVYAR